MHLEPSANGSSAKGLILALKPVRQQGQTFYCFSVKPNFVCCQLQAEFLFELLQRHKLIPLKGLLSKFKVHLIFKALE